MESTAFIIKAYNKRKVARGAGLKQPPQNVIMGCPQGGDGALAFPL